MIFFNNMIFLICYLALEDFKEEEGLISLEDNKDIIHIDNIKIHSSKSKNNGSYYYNLYLY